MMEIQALQSRQKEEIDALFTQMGKHPPHSVFSPAVAMAGGRRRRKSHRSARSSGQPSPIHSGKDSELLQFCFFGSQDKINILILYFMYMLYHFIAEAVEMICTHHCVHIHMFNISSLSSESSWFRVHSKAKYTISNRGITSS